MQNQQNTECLIEKSIARTLYVSTFADLNDEISQPLSMGKDYFDFAGDTPSTFKLEAARLVGILEQVNGKSINDLYSDAIAADNENDTPKLRDDFGHGLAMQSLGTGVSWFDNHERFELSFPFYYEVQAASINKQALLDLPDFDESALDEEQEIVFRDLPSKDSPHALYHRPAVGIAKAMILDAYAGRLEEREVQKNLLVSEIAKNEALILQGYRLLGAMEAINRHKTILLLTSEKDSRREEIGYSLNKQDLERYKALAHEDITYISDRMMGSLVNDIQTGQMIYEFFAKNRPIDGFADLIKPCIKLDTSMIKSIASPALDKGGNGLEP
ncbi:hypothetical protein ACI2KR_07895 [Pseudomonas luteola]